MEKTAFHILEEIFTNQINVMNIAVPVYPLDLESAKKFCFEKNFNVHLVRDPEHEDLFVYEKESDALRPLHDSEVISESTPLLEVVDILCKKTHVFIKVKRNIIHLVTRSDLDSIPVRIWMFGLISVFEIELKEIIRNSLENWEYLLECKRLQKASELYKLKKDRNEEIDLLGCIQLTDVGTIIQKSFEYFKNLFPVEYSQLTIGSFFNKINLLRDTLAHGQKIKFEWAEIHLLMQIISFSLSRINVSRT